MMKKVARTTGSWQLGRGAAQKDELHERFLCTYDRLSLTWVQVHEEFLILRKQVHLQDGWKLFVRAVTNSVRVKSKYEVYCHIYCVISVSLVEQLANNNNNNNN